jgi:hypothetical protein
MIQDHLELSEDAALVAALAGTAMSFSHSAEDQTERWLRALRLHGEVGSALQALGVGENRLARDGDGGVRQESPPLGDEAVDLVIKHARRHAAERQAQMICTPDLLTALFDVYGGLMERSLQERGTSRHELLERLGAASCG